jgi:hypothetical protein
VPLVSKPAAFACRAERLAWAGSGPDFGRVGPSGFAQGEGPDADAGEEMALNKSGKVGRYDIFDAPLVDLARRDQAVGDQLAQPRRGKRVVFVVIGRHAAAAFATTGAEKTRWPFLGATHSVQRIGDVRGGSK